MSVILFLLLMSRRRPSCPTSRLLSFARRSGTLSVGWMSSLASSSLKTDLDLMIGRRWPSLTGLSRSGQVILLLVTPDLMMVLLLLFPRVCPRMRHSFSTIRAMGALGHMVLSATEGFTKLYKKMEEFVNTIIGPPLDVNPDYVEEQDNGSVPKYIYSEKQNSQYDEFVSMQREWQVDVSDPLANAARTAAAYHIKILSSRREKVISKVRTANPRAATAISKIPPSASGMFGGDASQLEKVVKLAKDLSGSGKPTFQGSTPSNNHNNSGSFRGKRGNFRGGQRGSFNSGYGREDSKNKFSDSKPRGRGGNFRGRGH